MKEFPRLRRAETQKLSIRKIELQITCFKMTCIGMEDKIGARQQFFFGSLSRISFQSIIKKDIKVTKKLLSLP